MTVTWASGDTDICTSRNAVINLIVGPGWSHTALQPCRTVHRAVALPLDYDDVYIGCGRQDSHPRPSPWASAASFDADWYASDACEWFQRYLHQRCDVETWLEPLVGKMLVRDCNNTRCHGAVLMDEVNCRWPPLGGSLRASAGDLGETVRSSGTILEMIENADFAPSRHRAPTIIRTRVARGGQTSGSSLPQLVPDAMTPDAHLDTTLRLVHPVARPPDRTAPIAFALDHQADSA